MSDLLPSNATDTERAISETAARISDVPIRARLMWDAQNIPADLLPWLAWAYSVDDWNANWTVDQKRQAIANSINVHRYKGTVGAVKEAMQALGVEAYITEWFNMTPVGDPYTFSLVMDVQGSPLDEEALFRLLDVINAAKNLRSHLIEITPGATTNANLYCAAATVVGLNITIGYGGGNLISDGTVLADGTERANGIKFNV